MASHPVRVPEGIVSQLRVVSAVFGRSPGDVLADAFNEYLAHHREELREQFELAQKYVLSGDIDTMMDVTQSSRQRRAKKAAERIAGLRHQESVTAVNTISSGATDRVGKSSDGD